MGKKGEMAASLLANGQDQESLTLGQGQLLLRHQPVSELWTQGAIICWLRTCSVRKGLEMSGKAASDLRQRVEGSEGSTSHRGSSGVRQAKLEEKTVKGELVEVSYEETQRLLVPLSELLPAGKAAEVGVACFEQEGEQLGVAYASG